MLIYDDDNGGRTQLQPTAEASQSSDAQHAPPLIHYVVFDIETQRGPDEVEGGWAAMRRGAGGFGCGVIYDSACDGFELYGSSDLEAFIKRLVRAPLIVSFNGTDFDIPALEWEWGKSIDFNAHCDILSYVDRAVGRAGHGLAPLSSHTLGQGKVGTGADGPRLFALTQGEKPERAEAWVDLLNYCMRDVRLTRDLLRFARDNGYLLGPRGPIQLDLPDWFGRLA